MENQVSGKLKFLLLSGMIVTGTLNTITYKFQNSTRVYEENYPNSNHIREFFHPYMQAVAMFFGEFLCYFIYMGWKKFYRKDYLEEKREGLKKGLKGEINYFELAIPAIFDLTTSTLQHLALVFIPASIYQMMRGGVIIMVALGSRYYLKKQLILQQWIGCGFVILGITFVGIQSFFFQGSNSQSSDQSALFYSILLIVISWFTDGVRYIYEEKLFMKYHINPLQLVGIEGMYGLFFYAIILPIFCNSHCTFPAKACIFQNSGFVSFESFTLYFSEMAQSGQLVFWCILGVFSILFFNILGVTTTKKLSALIRSLTDITRTSFVWIICLILTWTGAENWENTRWQSILCQFIGFLLMIFGNLVYQKIIKFSRESQDEVLKQKAYDQILEQKMINENE